MARATFETDEEAYDAFYNAFLEQSRNKHRFQSVRKVERSLGTKMKTYGIKSRKVKADVIRQRLKEIYAQDPDIGGERIEELLGIDIWEYVKDLGFKTLSEVRTSFAGRKTRKKFDTKEEALNAFRTEVKERIIKRERKAEHFIEKVLGTNTVNYGIDWKGEVLYPVYTEIIREELEKNPIFGIDELRLKYPHVRTFLERQDEPVRFKIKNKIPITENEEDELLCSLILEAVRPKPEPPTPEGYIWEFIKHETGKSYDTLRIPKEIEYLKSEKKIEGNRLVGGYWSVE
jgi:hypothetical protein